jgi:hypothetical protein
LKGNTYTASLLRFVENAIADEAEHRRRSDERLAFLRAAAGDLQSGRHVRELTIDQIKRATAA